MIRWYWHRSVSRVRCWWWGHDWNKYLSDRYKVMYCNRCPYTELEERWPGK